MSVVASQLIAKVSTEGVIKAKQDLSEMGKSADNAKESMEKSGASAADFGKNLLGVGLIAGAAAVAIGVTAVNAAGNFQSSMTGLVTAAGESANNLGIVREGILKLAVDTGTSTKQLADGMFNVESASFHGADGLRVLEAAAKGAKVGHADLATATSALTTVMTDYHFKAEQATAVMNMMNAASGSGKMELQNLASSMGVILPLASALGVSFPQIGGAMSVMTNAGMSAEQSAQDLANTLRSLAVPNAVAVKSMQSVGISAQQLKDSLGHQGLAATLQLIEDHVGKTFPAGSVQATHALEKIMGGATGFNVALMLGGKNMQSYKDAIDLITKSLSAGGNEIVGWADVQKDWNFKVDQAKEIAETFMIRLGTGLLPVLSKVADVVLPAVAAFSNWAFSGHAVADVIKFITDHSQVMVPVLSGVGVIVGGLLVAAFISLGIAAWGAAAGVIAATWPFLLLGAAVAGLVAIFMHFYQTSAPFKIFIDNLVKGLQQAWSTIQANFIPVMMRIGQVIQTQVLPFLQQVVAFLISTFKPVWDQIVITWQTQLLPALIQVGTAVRNLWTALQPLAPVLQVVGTIIGTVVVFALGVFLATVVGITKGIAGMLPGITQAFGGFVQIISGAIQIITGIITFFVDLFTFKWSKLGADLGVIWQGIVTMFHGVWNLIAGIFSAAVGLVVGYISGFVTTVLGFFKGLGDSIRTKVSEIVANVVDFFSKLPGRVMSFLSSLPGNIKGIWDTAIKDATNAGANIVKGIASGITGAIQWVKDAIGTVSQWISDHLPHSPAKIGPLRDLVKQGGLITQQIGEGMLSSLPKLQASLNMVVQPISDTVGAQGGGSSPAFIGLPAQAQSQGSSEIHVHNHIYLDGREITDIVMTRAMQRVRGQGGGTATL